MIGSRSEAAPRNRDACPASLRAAYDAIAAAGELEHLAALRDEALEVYARGAAAEAHRRGMTEVAAADVEDLAAWLREQATGATPRADRHGEWSTCERCGYPAQITRAVAYGGFLCATGGTVLCWDGRECSLRMRRRRRG